MRRAATPDDPEPCERYATRKAAEDDEPRFWEDPRNYDRDAKKTDTAYPATGIALELI